MNPSLVPSKDEQPESSTTQRRSLWQARFSAMPHHHVSRRGSSVKPRERQGSVSTPSKTPFTCVICSAQFSKSDFFLRHQQSCANHSLDILTSTVSAPSLIFGPLSSNSQADIAYGGLTDGLSLSPSQPSSSPTYKFAAVPSPDVVDWSVFSTPSIQNQPLSSIAYPSPSPTDIDAFAPPSIGLCTPSLTEELGPIPPFDLNLFSPELPALAQDTDSKMAEYLQLFYSAYLPEHPVVHLTKAQDYQKNWLVLKAMQACGAGHAGTPEANVFVLECVQTLLETVSSEFGKATDTVEQDNIIIAASLLLTIPTTHGLHTNYVNSYRDATVKMIRQSQLIKRLSSWVTPENLHAASLDLVNALWTQWAHYESMKRILFFVYMQDGVYCMQQLLPPSFNPRDLSNVNLMCSPLLFRAEKATEWRTLIRSSSEPAAIIGIKLNDALTAIGAGNGKESEQGQQTRPSMPVLNSCSQKAVIQTVNMLLYISRMTAQLLRQPGGISRTQRRPSSSSASSSSEGRSQTTSNAGLTLLTLPTPPPDVSFP